MDSLKGTDISSPLLSSPHLLSALGSLLIVSPLLSPFSLLLPSLRSLLSLLSSVVCCELSILFTVFLTFSLFLLSPRSFKKNLCLLSPLLVCYASLSIRSGRHRTPPSKSLWMCVRMTPPAYFDLERSRFVKHLNKPVYCFGCLELFPSQSTSGDSRWTIVTQDIKYTLPRVARCIYSSTIIVCGGGPIPLITISCRNNGHFLPDSRPMLLLDGLCGGMRVCVTSPGVSCNARVRITLPLHYIALTPLAVFSTLHRNVM